MPPSSASGKPTKACITCNHRKLKCDAAIVGLPCSRCVTKGYPETCALANRRRRKTVIPAKDKRQALYDAGTQTQLARQAETKSTNQLSETYTSQDGRMPFQGWDLIDGRKGVHYMSILGQLARNEQAYTPRVSGPTIGTKRPEKENGPQRVNAILNNMRLNNADKEYLQQRGAFTLPSQPCCESMLRQHFISVYPLIPVFNYVDFMNSYFSGSYSWFMMQAILASAVPYTPLEVLTDCGFKDRSTALEFFFSNAVKLYDFGYEESQLVKLQGSLVLSTILVSYTIDKDFRFWHHNAVRLAMRLGLHKESEKLMFPKCREIIFSIIHLETPRLIQCNIRQAPEVEWWHNHIPSSHGSIIPSWTEGQKRFSGEHMKLAIIATRWQEVLRTLDNGQPPISQNIDEEISSSFAEWRESLPRDKSISRSVSLDRVDDIWVAALEASCYRFECIFYRSLLIRSLTGGETSGRVDVLKQRLRMAVFELDTIVSRLIMNNLLRFANLNISLAVTSIRRTELALKQICEVVPAMDCNLRLLHRFLDQRMLDAASTSDILLAENQSSGETQEHESQELNQNMQDFGQSGTNELELRADAMNSNLRLQDDDASEVLGDMNNWLDGLVWLDYLKDSSIIPN
ncbi:hypothetical protein TrVGV298_008248 [Trichoderma virens]|nr:hypothetical protein TrVGV298_008248 [Trichoderma virens]